MYYLELGRRLHLIPPRKPWRAGPEPETQPSIWAHYRTFARVHQWFRGDA